MSQISKLQTRELVKDWIAALKSGQYQQGQGKLRGWDDTYCCLGVLVDLIIDRNWIPIVVYAPDVGNSHRDRYLYEYGQSIQGNYVPMSVADYIGMRDNNGRYGGWDYTSGGPQYLAEHNDRGMSFEEIAQIIEDHQTELFPILAE